MKPQTEIAVFGAGCFWCTEAIFSSLRGVISVLPGYTGGTKPNPTYEDVCSGKTGHAEVARITFDPSVIPYRDLLDIYWHTHDPTTRNMQGNDVGTQYRSVIFTTSDKQKAEAETLKKDLDASGDFPKPIVTEIQQLDIFYEAENYHKEYYAKNSYQPYCQVVISPKLAHLREKYSKKLKDNALS